MTERRRFIAKASGVMAAMEVLKGRDVVPMPQSAVA